EVIFPDFIERHHPADTLDIPIILIPAVNVLDVSGQEFVLGAACLAFAGGVNEEHLLPVVFRLSLAEYQNAGRKTCAVKEVRPESDGRLQNVHLQEFAPYFAFLGHAEQYTMRQHNRHSSGL